MSRRELAALTARLLKHEMREQGQRWHLLRLQARAFGIVEGIL